MDRRIRIRIHIDIRFRGPGVGHIDSVFAARVRHPPIMVASCDRSLTLVFAILVDATRPSCPWPSANAITVINDVVAHLLPEGRVDDALECSKLLLANHAKGGKGRLSENELDVAEGNARIFYTILAPRRPGHGRLWHSFNGGGNGFPADSDTPLVKQPDRSVMVFDDVLTPVQVYVCVCACIFAQLNVRRSCQGVVSCSVSHGASVLTGCARTLLVVHVIYGW